MNEASSLTIAHVMGYFMPGLGYQENHLPFAQAAAGHRVHIVTGDRHIPHPDYNAIYGPQLGPRMVGPGVSRMGEVTLLRLPVAFESARRQNPALSGLVEAIADLKPDIIHLHGVTPLTSLQVMASTLHRHHAIVCDHHLCAFNMQPWTALKRAYYALFRLAVLPALSGRVKAWLPISDDAGRVLADCLGITGSNVTVNPLGVDCATFRRSPALGAEWRRRNGLPEGRPLIVHAGKLEPRKNVHVLVEAFRRCSLDATLAIAGGGSAEYLDALRAVADERVVFLPFQPHGELPGLYNAADLGVWPGDDSITIGEARGCGLPMVLTDGSMWVEPAGSRCRWLVGRGATSPLAAVLDRFSACSEDERQSIAKTVADTLSWTVVAGQSVDIYRRAMRRG